MSDLKDYEIFCLVTGYIVSKDGEKSMEETFQNADLGECRDADGEEVGDGVLQISGGFTTYVTAETLEEAMEKAEENFGNADCGDMCNIEHEDFQYFEYKHEQELSSENPDYSR